MGTLQDDAGTDLHRKQFEVHPAFMSFIVCVVGLVVFATSFYFHLPDSDAAEFRQKPITSAYHAIKWNLGW